MSHADKSIERDEWNSQSEDNTTQWCDFQTQVIALPTSEVEQGDHKRQGIERKQEEDHDEHQKDTSNKSFSGTNQPTHNRFGLLAQCITSTVTIIVDDSNGKLHSDMCSDYQDEGTPVNMRP